jgi:hypothetical protein
VKAYKSTAGAKVRNMGLMAETAWGKNFRGQLFEEMV